MGLVTGQGPGSMDSNILCRNFTLVQDRDRKQDPLFPIAPALFPASAHSQSEAVLNPASAPARQIERKYLLR